MQIIGHRGARLLALENTVDALRIAYDEGADGVEFDVRLSGDGELVVWHDDDLLHFGGGHVPVRRTPWRVLRQIQLTDEHGHRGRIPHLEQVLELLEHRSGPINPELKVDGKQPDDGLYLGAAFAERMANMCADGWVVSSFDRQALETVATRTTTLELAALVEELPCDFEMLAASDVDTLRAGLTSLQADMSRPIVALHAAMRLVDEARVAAWRIDELAIRVWTANKPSTWRRLLELGVDATITDDPGGLRHALERDGVRGA